FTRSYSRAAFTRADRSFSERWTPSPTLSPGRVSGTSSCARGFPPRAALTNDRSSGSAPPGPPDTTTSASTTCSRNMTGGASAREPHAQRNRAGQHYRRRPGSGLSVPPVPGHGPVAVGAADRPEDPRRAVRLGEPGVEVRRRLVLVERDSTQVLPPEILGGNE